MQLIRALLSFAERLNTWRSIIIDMHLFVRYQELGVEKDDKVDMIAKFALKIEDFEARKVDEKIMTVIKDEMQKLSSLERNSPEFNVTRSYLDWLTSVPWKVLTEDRSVCSLVTHSPALRHYSPRRDRENSTLLACTIIINPIR
jgi:ATP-dependent Lon protease